METTEVIATKNPIIPRSGLCDPHIHVWGDRAYLFASHDVRRDATDYVMRDWQVWSSADLVSWRFESSLRPEDTYIGPTDAAWAVDAAERNGRYYLYFSNGTTDTGVAVAEQPGGPYHDALGGPLLPEHLTPTKQYDPSIFIDEDPDQTPYIVFGTPVWAGGDSYYIARLNEDMVSLAEKPRKVELDDDADDKPFLHRHGDRYYLSWASFYAESDSVYGPYRYRGNIGASPDHGSFFQWRGQWFHAFTVMDPTLYHRGTGLCYVHYRSDGSMVTDQLIVEHGVGRYDAQWNRIEAEWFMSGSGIEKRENPRFGFDVVPLAEKSQVLYPNIRNVPQQPQLTLFAANAGSQAVTVEVRLGSSQGELLGTCTVHPTGTSHWRGYRNHWCRLDTKSAALDLCLVVQSTANSEFRFDHFSLTAL